MLKSFAGLRTFARRRWVVLFAHVRRSDGDIDCLDCDARAVLTPSLRSRIVRTLSERLNADVELGAVTLPILPRFEVRERISLFAAGWRAAIRRCSASRPSPSTPTSWVCGVGMST